MHPSQACAKLDQFLCVVDCVGGAATWLGLTDVAICICLSACDVHRLTELEAWFSVVLDAECGLTRMDTPVVDGKIEHDDVMFVIGCIS